MLDEATKNKVKEIVFNIISSKGARVFVFGSRATGKAAKFSDVDLGIEAKTSFSNAKISEIKESFENSNLPFKVDVVDFSRVTKKFNDIATKKIITLN